MPLENVTINYTIAKNKFLRQRPTHFHGYGSIATDAFIPCIKQTPMIQRYGHRIASASVFLKLPRLVRALYLCLDLNSPDSMRTCLNLFDLFYVYQYALMCTGFLCIFIA